MMIHGLGATINIQETVDMLHSNSTPGYDPCTDPVTGNTYATYKNDAGQVVPCGGTGSGYASGTSTPLPSTTSTGSGMTDAQMQAAAAAMCQNAGQTWDVASQLCKNTIIPGISNGIVYAFAGVLGLMLFASLGGRRR